jgi:hypothetical protein
MDLRAMRLGSVDWIQERGEGVVDILTVKNISIQN